MVGSECIVEKIASDFTTQKTITDFKILNINILVDGTTINKDDIISPFSDDTTIQYIN